MPPEIIAASVANGPVLWRLLVQDVLSKGYRRIVIPHLAERIGEGAALTETLRDIPLAYTGTSSLTSITDSAATVKYLDSSIPGAITSGELARAYMTRCRNAALSRHTVDEMAAARVPWQRDAIPLLDLRPPLYYRPGPVDDGRHVGEFAYIDISAAYWQLTRHATLDMRYRPGDRYLGHGIIAWYDTEDVLAFKQMRVSIHGIARTSEIAVLKRGEFSTRNLHRGAVWLAPDLVGYVMHTMQAVAAEIVDTFGAPMVLTDAYIVPAKQATDVLEFLAERWHMPARIVAMGRGALYSLGCYQVAGHKSKHAPPRYTNRRSELFQIPEAKPADSIDPAVRELTDFLNDRRQWLVTKGLERHGLHEAEKTSTAGLDLSWMFPPGGAPTTPERSCERCGWPLPAGMRESARFCSDRCKDLSQKKRSRKREKLSGPRPCQQCGSELLADARASTRFCSDRCRDQARRTRERKRA